MTIITAKVIEDSISQHGVRLTTLQLCYPRFIHSEFLTHRVFSRNASSSRAIPVAKMIEQVRNEPAMPIHWGKNQPGMQANEELAGEELANAKEAWLTAAELAATQASILHKIGAHKQVANRILEPFQYMHVIVTATEWDNFFELRDHPDAQPEIHALAIVMKHAFANSRPVILLDGGWHLPYVTRAERAEHGHDIELLLKLSAARCARVSYLTHDGQEPSIEKDVALYERLVGGVPLHASPIEHQATPLSEPDMWSGNFRGWLQNRKLVESSFGESA
jgi:thymidylate synthase ThyX